MKTISTVTQTSTTTAEQMSSAIRSWWSKESSDWDAEVSGASSPRLPGGADLWDRMPVVDSKAVARSTHIFERYLGIPLNTKLIRAGGYKNIEDMITHLVPAMLTVAKKK